MRKLAPRASGCRSEASQVARQGELIGEAIQVEDARPRRAQKALASRRGRAEVYAKAVEGRFRTIKWAALAALLGVYYLAPWLRWNRGPGLPAQAILADVPGRRLYFFWVEIWPQEVYYLTGVLILAAFGLFLATSLFGRVWCGFACPQTVWTDLFMQVERWIEGDRAERMRLDQAPWTAAKLRRRALKHAAWLGIAFLTGGAWITYFNDAPTVVRAFFSGEAGAAAYFFVALFTATTYLLAGFARDRVCAQMCPWPRIQGALVDQDTRAITYEAWRGEPRGLHRRGASREGRGDCVDCGRCVAVCPMGIDIRDGFQLECIGCGLCVDACDDVMAKVGRPPNLIAYDSRRNQVRRAQGRPPVRRLVRPRTALYALVLALTGGAMLAALATRATVDLGVLPERNPLFVRLADGSVRNGYTLRLINKGPLARTFELGVAHPEARLSVLGRDDRGGGGGVALPAPADGVASYRAFVRLPRSAVPAEVNDIAFTLRDPATGAVAEFRSVFRGPGR